MDYKLTIRKIIREQIDNLLREDIESVNNWNNFKDELTGQILLMIKNGEKVTFDLIPVSQYHHALKEFMQYGKFMRFPEKYIFQWKQLLLENIAKLEVLTAISGHTSHFPFDEFYDIFNYQKEYQTQQLNLFSRKLEHEKTKGEFSEWAKEKYKETGDKDYLKDYNFGAAYEFLDEVYKIEDILPLFSNGQWVLSDYGLEPLFKLGEEILSQDDPNEIIVTINKILDVSHQRSDLAELFIEGGSKSLDYISAAE